VPRVDFYITEDKQPDARLRLACRVVEKGYLAEQRVLVWCGDQNTLDRIDELLWTFGDSSFVPHEVVKADTPVALAPVSLTTDGPLAQHFDMLVNLAAAVPGIWRQCDRVAEILDGGETRAAGRERFRYYREHGTEPETHRIGRPR